MSQPVTSVMIDVPVRLKSEANQRGHWRGGYQRSKQQKDAVLCAWLQAGRPKVIPPCLVTITRFGAGVMDSDNLQRAAKAVRDAVAKHVLETDDGSDLIRWEYRQEKTPRKVYGCRVEVQSDGT